MPRLGCLLVLPVLLTSLFACAQDTTPSECTPMTYFGVTGCALLPSGECPQHYHKQAVGPQNPQIKAPTRLMCVPDEGAGQPAASPQPTPTPNGDSEKYSTLPIEKKLETFPNGRRKTEYSFYHDKDGREVVQGKYLQWHENGQKASSCNYVNGEKEGVCLWWDDRGKQTDSVEYVHGKPRAIAEWEARDTRAIKTPIYLYPYIVIHSPSKLTFISNYAGIAREFSLSQMNKVFTSLPASVWVDGKSIGIEQPGLATEQDHRAMDAVAEKVKAFFIKKGYRVYGMPS